MPDNQNRIPERVSKIHLIAVCGTAMGALACMLKNLGFDISGSDQHVYPPMSDFLREQGIAVLEGFKAEHISDATGLVVVGNAVSRDNPEVQKLMTAGIPFCSMPQALNRFVARGKKTIVVCGTHGKTTTSSILAWVLYQAGLDPSFMIGGILQNFNSNYRLGTGQHMIIEGDEYDTAFFDKGPKFMHYQPAMTILTGVEFDHADIFRDLDHLKMAFGDFVRKLDRSSTLLAFDADENVRQLIAEARCRIERYGKSDSCDWRLGRFRVAPPWTHFEVLKSGHLLAEFKTKLIGRHNLFNALAAVGIAHHLGVPVEGISSGLETFAGIKRRQQIRGQKNQIMVFDDFAHHPTAVRETIQAVKSAYPHNRLLAVFEPRTNSSMRKVFQNVYPASFDEADLICIRRPPLLEKIPPDDRFSSEQLVADLKKRGKDARYFADTQAIIEFLVGQAAPGDLILVMSNGGFDNIHQRLLDRL